MLDTKIITHRFKAGVIMVIHITRENVQKEISQETLPIVIEVFAPWCGPCQQMAPIFESVAKEYEGKLKCAQLNVDEERDLSISYEVTSIPTFLFIKNNQVKDKMTGFMSRDRLIDAIEGFLR